MCGYKEIARLPYTRDKPKIKKRINKIKKFNAFLSYLINIDREMYLFI